MCPHCGKAHGFKPEDILASCAAVSAVEFNAKGQITRIEYFPSQSMVVVPAPIKRKAVHERVVVETKTGADGKRVVTKTRST